MHTQPTARTRKGSALERRRRERSAEYPAGGRGGARERSTDQLAAAAAPRRARGRSTSRHPPKAYPDNAQAALVAAKAAQPAWAATGAATRGEALKAMARVIRANRVELAELLAKEQNKVAGLAQVEIDFTAESPPRCGNPRLGATKPVLTDFCSIRPSVDGSRRRRGCHVDMPRRRVAVTLRLPCG